MRLLGDERGMALIMVVGTASVLSIISSVIAVQSISNLRQNATERTFERALHVSEAGVDDLLFRLRETEGAYDTGETAPSSFASVQAEEQWAMDRADAAVAADPDRLASVREGEWVSIRPSNQAVIYAIGYVPNYADAREIRVVRAEYDFAPFDPTTAVLTNGNLTLDGNPTVAGTGGHAHANGNVEISGDPSISGHVTSSGGYSESGNPSIGDPGNSGGSHSQIEAPDVEPRENYGMSEYDLCPDGTVRTGPSYDAGLELIPGATDVPCNGTILGPTGTEFRGFKKTGDDASQGAKWSLSGNTAFDGVYYAYQGSIKISGNPGSAAAPWRVTLFAEASAAGDEPHCNHVGGDIQISGNPYMRGHDKGQGLGLVAERDLEISGNAGVGTDDYIGVHAAHEQFKVSGNPSIDGALIANDLCNTPGSPTGPGSSISGNPTVEFNGASVPLGTNVRTTLWLEI